MKTISIVMILGVLLTPALSALDDVEETLISIEKGYWKASETKDRAYYAKHSAEDVFFVSEDGPVVGRDATMEIDFRCDIHNYELRDWRVHSISDDVAIVTYTASFDQTCDGKRAKGQAVTSSTYARRNGKWLSVAYQNTPRNE